MIHPHTEVKFISEEIGYGVVAKQLIPKGTITWVLDELDREISPSEVEQMGPVAREMMDTYSYRNSSGNFVLCWDNGRFVNHSFNSTCLSTAYDFEVAVRDIQPGEQLTDDYGYLNISEPFKAYSEGTRRKTVYPDDLLRYHKTWDKQLLSAFKNIPHLEQPLKRLISPSLWSKVEAIAKGEQAMDSILNIYYEGDKVKPTLSKLRRTAD